MMAGGSANPSGRSTTTSMPRMAAMCTVAAGTASGSARGWLTHDSTNSRLSRHGEIVERLPVRQRLAGMIGRRLHIDDGFVDEADHFLERGFVQIRLEVRAAGERPDAQSVTIVGQYGHSFAHMLRGCAIHDRAAPRLELPGALAGGDHEGVAAQPRHRRLHRRERAQRGIEEQQAEDLAGERMRLRLLRQTFGEREQLDDLLALTDPPGRENCSCEIQPAPPAAGRCALP